MFRKPKQTAGRKISFYIRIEKLRITCSSICFLTTNTRQRDARDVVTKNHVVVLFCCVTAVMGFELLLFLSDALLELFSCVTEEIGDDDEFCNADTVTGSGKMLLLPTALLLLLLLPSLACCNMVYTLSTLLRFSRKGIKSNSSRSLMSSNQDATGT